jgi:hypothetical protein
MTRTEKDKMLAGDLYDAGAPELQADAAAAHERLVRYNAAFGTPISERRELLLEHLAAVGEGAVIRPPFHCDYGFNISLGEGVFLNFNCVILDVAEVTIGDAGSACSASKPAASTTRSRPKSRSAVNLTSARYAPVLPPKVVEAGRGPEPRKRRLSRLRASR